MFRTEKFYVHSGNLKVVLLDTSPRFAAMRAIQNFWDHTITVEKHLYVSQKGFNKTSSVGIYSSTEIIDDVIGEMS